MDKPIGTFLQAGAAFMFYAAGAFHGDALLLVVPGAVSGIAGLLLWARGEKAPLRHRDEPLLHREEPVRLERQVAQLQDSLEALHDEVRQLREGREFDKQLYATSSELSRVRGSATTESA